MYKKIMFLIITLSIIINVGNSTVVMAKENIVTEIVDFPVTINYEEYNVDDYNANDMMLCEYPMVVYKNMTYIPLTYYNCILLGLEVQFDKNILSVEKRDSGKPTEYLRDQSSEKNTKNIINMEVSPFIVNIQDNNYNDEEYPALFYKNIVYLPLTWKVVYDYMKSLSDENAQYNEVETLNGKKTESGFTYRVYYMDVEIRKGQTARHYKFFVTVDETDIILIDAYHYKFKDGSGEEDYLEKYILPVVGSFDIVKN